MYVGKFINLDHRTDRREHFESTIKRLDCFKGIDRLSAIRHTYGALGCCKSHVRALEECLRQHPTASSYWIFEDDFSVLPGRESLWEEFLTSMEAVKDLPDWDVILLTSGRNWYRRWYAPPVDQNSAAMIKAGFNRVNQCITMTAFVVKASYVHRLLEVFRKSEILLTQGADTEQGAHDMLWLPLQNVDNFFTFKAQLSCQQPGFSDIEQRYTNSMQQFL